MQSSHGDYQCVAPGGCFLPGERGARQDRVAAFQTSHSPQGPRLTLSRSICRDVLGEVGDLPAAHPSWCHSVKGTGRWVVRPTLQRAWSMALHSQSGDTPTPCGFLGSGRWKGPERGRATTALYLCRWGNKLREAKGVAQSHTAGQREGRLLSSSSVFSLHPSQPLVPLT